MKKIKSIILLIIFTLVFLFQPILPFIGTDSVVDALYNNILKETKKFTLPYTSEIVYPKDEYTSLALAWQADRNDFDIQVRTLSSISNKWSDWKDVSQQNDAGKTLDTTKSFSNLEFFEKSKGFQFKLNGNKDVTFKYIDVLTISNKDILALKPNIANQTEAKYDNLIISRSEWGATTDWIYYDKWKEERDKLCKEKSWYCAVDPKAIEAVNKQAKELAEKYPDDTKIEATYDSIDGNELLWSVSKSEKIKELVVHHDASLSKDQNGDGVFNEEDEKIAIRNIYYYHSITRGWGDIGYNFIVGPSGNVYEGRVGGDKAVAAHSVWRNISSIGVSNLGNFEDEQFGEKQKNGLVAILSYLSKKYNIDPTASSVFYDKTQKGIIGHRDLAPTACPGKNLYAQMDDIRAKVKANKESYNSITPIKYNLSSTDSVDKINTSESYHASYIPAESASWNMNPTEEKTIELKFKNTGTKAWDTNTYIRTITPISNYFIALSGDKNFEKLTYLDKAVFPGEIGVFKIKIHAKYRGYSGNPYFEPVINGTQVMDKFFLPITVNDKKVSFDFVSKNISNTLTTFDEKLDGVIILKNTGEVTWKNEDNLAPTVFAKMSDGSVILASLQENQVLPGYNATFKFALKTPYKEGNLKYDFNLNIPSYDIINTSPFSFIVNIKHPLDMKTLVLDQILPKVNKIVRNSQPINIELVLKNNSTNEWDNIDKYKLGIYIPDTLPIDLVTPISDVSFSKINILPGDQVTLDFKIKANDSVIGNKAITLSLDGRKIGDYILPISIINVQENSNLPVSKVAIGLSFGSKLKMLLNKGLGIL